MLCKTTAAQRHPSRRAHHLMFDSLLLQQPSQEKYLAIRLQPKKPLWKVERPTVEYFPTTSVVRRRAKDGLNRGTR